MLKPEFAKRTDELVDKAAHIYAKLLTEQEIRAAIAFFTSDAGKKYIEVRAGLLQRRPSMRCRIGTTRFRKN